MGHVTLFPWVKRPGREVFSPPSSAEVKNEWSYKSTPHTPSWLIEGQLCLLHRLKLFETRVQMGVCGPKRGEMRGECWILHNVDLNDLKVPFRHY
jgi:hypothetical protein